MNSADEIRLAKESALHNALDDVRGNDYDKLLRGERILETLKKYKINLSAPMSGSTKKWEKISVVISSTSLTT